MMNQKDISFFKPKTNKIVVSRGVIFDELVAQKWEDEFAMAQTFKFNKVEVLVQNPTGSTEVSSSRNNAEDEHIADETLPRRYHSLIDIYEQTNFALAVFESHNFEEVDKEKKMENRNERRDDMYREE